MSLLLTIDAGNTNTVLGVHHGAQLQAHWRLTTRREQTADVYGILVRNLFASSGIEPGQIGGVALASVVRNPGRVLGRSTVGSMQSGLYFGYASMVEGLIRRIRAELGEPAKAVATGGLAESIAPDIPSIEAVDPVLTLTGLRLIWERNRAPGGR